jgi:hypothetical protein
MKGKQEMADKATLQAQAEALRSEIQGLLDSRPEGGDPTVIYPRMEHYDPDGYERLQAARTELCKVQDALGEIYLDEEIAAAEAEVG